MAKFIKGSGSDNKRKRTSTGSRADKQKSEPGYKAKRSFTKNKSYRESGAGKEEGGSGKTHSRPFRKDYSKGGAERPRRAYGDKDESRAGDAAKTAPREYEKKSSTKQERYESYSERSPRPAKTGRTGSDDFKKNKPFLRERPERAGDGGDGKKRRFSKPRPGEEDRARRVNYAELEGGKAFSRGKREERPKDRKVKKTPPAEKVSPDGLIRLNKYLSNAGIASRRDADTLIQSGAVKVNGVVVDQLGYKIKQGDKVTYGDEAVKGERKVYLLLNKPKDYITTMDDPQNRKTVMDLLKGACKERVYPVGRLDRNTTGLLLLTNDGELTTKLTHPKFGIKKVYHVSLNKGLKADDFKKIIEGVELEDGMIKADDLAFVGEGKKEVGIEIHSGRNRVVRRLFEHLGYEVLKLDRVVFAGLTKKDLPRGKHRFLTAKEISFLKMIG
jgi:23S rRNA pseudouridine2605 synthase